MAPPRLWHFAEFIQDFFGNAIPGATVTVIDRDTGAPIAIYKDGEGVNRESNPLPSSGSGFVSFYAGPRKSVNLLVASAAASFTIADVAADTVEAHRQAGDHDAGTITADQLAFEITNPDLAIHVVQESNTHGLASNEYFACTKAGADSAATSSPTFADVTVDSLTVADGGSIHGILVADCSIASINSAISTAKDGDTIFVKGPGNVTTPTAMDTTSTAIVVNKAVTIKALGNIRIRLSGSNPLFVIDTHGAYPVTIDGFSVLRFAGTSDFIEINNALSVRLSNLYHDFNSSAGTYGVYIEEDSVIGPVLMWGCVINALNGALRVNGISSSIYATDCRFSTSSLTDYGVAILKGSVEPHTGHSFTACNIEGSNFGLYVDSHNCKFLGCSITDISGANEAVNVTANGTSCYLPTNANTVSGSITDASSNIVGNAASWDYDSTVTIDNNGATYEDEYFVQSFTHNLGTRHLECLIEVANNAGFSDKVWTFAPQLYSVYHSTTPLAPGAAAWSVCFTADNVAKLVLYAGRSRSGGTISTSKKWIWNAVDPTAIVDNVNSVSYNFADAGGYELDKVWVRFRLRRA